MTREEKISRLKDILAEINEDKDAVCYLTSEDNELIESAIEALEQQPCEDAISRQAVLDKKELVELADGQSFYCISPEDVETLPPVIPKPKTGHWISYWDEEARCQVYKCPECGNKQPFDTKYCWECGTRLNVPDINDGKLSETPTSSESEDKK